MSASQVARQSNEPFFKAPIVFKRRDAKGFPVGPRTERRQAENRKLNTLPPEVKNVCELRIKGVCIGNRMLTWAHSQKSRFLTTSKDWQEAARSCLACHQHVEQLKHSEMKEIICGAINRRKA